MNRANTKEGAFIKEAGTNLKGSTSFFLEAMKKWFKLRSALPSFFHFLLFHSFVIKTTIKFTFAFATQLGFENKRPRRLSTNECALIKSSGKA